MSMRSCLVFVWISSLLLVAPAFPQVWPGQREIPVRNWQAPPHWRPTSGETQANAAALSSAEPTPDATTSRALPTATLAFVAITPCRLVDTRGATGETGAFGPPIMDASEAANGETRTIPVLSNTRCVLPSTALAYSLNFTVVPSRPLEYLSAWPTGNPPNPPVSILNSLTGAIVANAAVIAGGTGGSFDVFVTDTTQVIVDINGYYIAASGGSLGATGPTGPQGPAGPAGATGPMGATGPQGPAGTGGGAGGATGPTGPQGLPGPAGATGAQGPAGSTGVTGAQGPIGPTGAIGPQGLAGLAGATGPQGPVGPAGASGAQGPVGPAGAIGAQGPAGPMGAAGAQGPSGPAGAQGTQGVAGAQGPAGPPGATGSQGPMGSPGPAGQGYTWRNAWSSTSTYAAYDTVSYSGSSYVAIAANTNVTPGTDATKWSLIAQGLSEPLSGTAGAPAITIGDPTTGLFSAGPDTVAVATGGTTQLTVLADGNLDLTSGGNISQGGNLLLHDVGPGNLSLGLSALPPNSGQANVAVGNYALRVNASGGYETAVGYAALAAIPSGQNNTAVGGSALANITNGNFNTAVGENAGFNNTVTTVANSTFIGDQASPGADNLTYATAIGAGSVVSQSNALILGGTGLFAAVTVGIGTATPYDDYALDVEATTNSTINGGVVVNANGGNLYLGMTSGTHKFRVDYTGKVYADGGSVTSGADFAESVAVSGSTSLYEAGDLLAIEHGARRRLTLSSTPYSTMVAGIYSTKPGVLATPHPIDDKLEGEVPLAVVGIVPCKVTAENGAIHEGDLLVTSSHPGYAMKGKDRKRMLGAVVGKALEPLPKGTGVIQVLVTLQ